MKSMVTLTVAAVIAFAVTASAQEPATLKPVVQAFEHYEGVRVALAADKFADVAVHATALLPLADAAGGAKAKRAAEQLVAAKTLDDARRHFGDLSDILVPLFHAEAIPGTQAFVCAMKKKSWVQRGEKIENPYYGKSMLTCGSPLPAKGK